MEGQRLLALGDHLCLEVDDGRVEEEPWFLSNSEDLSLETRQIVIIACKLERKSEVLRVIHIRGNVLELELERSASGTDAQRNVAF